MKKGYDNRLRLGYLAEETWDGLTKERSMATKKKTAKKKTAKKKTAKKAKKK
jgi:hypothetical protein